MVKVKRIYDTPAGSDGYRILVDRLWPRGIKKEKAAVDLWLKEVAPSHELRKHFHADRDQFAAFKKDYQAELKNNAAWQELKRLAKNKNITLLYASKDEERNHAILLQQMLSL